MQRPGYDPRPIHVTTVLQQLHVQPISPLDVLTALADHLASRTSLLETQVEGWGSIHDFSPHPAHRHQLVAKVIGVPPQDPHLGPKTWPLV